MAAAAVTPSVPVLQQPLVTRENLQVRFAKLNELPSHTQLAELAILHAALQAITKYEADCKAYLDAVESGMPPEQKPKFKIGASAGFIMYSPTGQVCLGQLNKPKVEDARIDGSHSTMSGKVEEEDFLDQTTPVCVNAAAREGSQEAHGAYSMEYLKKYLMEPSTLMLPNPPMKKLEKAVKTSAAEAEKFVAKPFWAGPVFAAMLPESILDTVARLNQTANTTIANIVRAKLESPSQNFLSRNDLPEMVRFDAVDLSSIFREQESIDKAYADEKAALKAAYSWITEEDLELLQQKKTEKFLQKYPETPDATMTDLNARVQELINIYNTIPTVDTVDSVDSTTGEVQTHKVHLNDAARRTLSGARAIFETAFKMAH